MNNLTGLKDIDREVLKHVNDKDLLKACSIDRRMWNEVCDDDFLRRRLSKYPGIEKYKREKESWKQFFLRVIYYIAIMKQYFQFDYIQGDFKKQSDYLENYKGQDLLFYSAEQGELDLVKYAIKNYGLDAISLNSALRVASESGHLSVVKYLVEKGANIHAKNDFALRYARMNGHLDVVEYLLEKGSR